MQVLGTQWVLNKCQLLPIFHIIQKSVHEKSVWSPGLVWLTNQAFWCCRPLSTQFVSIAWTTGKPQNGSDGPSVPKTPLVCYLISGLITVQISQFSAPECCSCGLPSSLPCLNHGCLKHLTHSFNHLKESHLWAPASLGISCSQDTMAVSYYTDVTGFVISNYLSFFSFPLPLVDHNNPTFKKCSGRKI
jgi:hypothetical protein